MLVSQTTSTGILIDRLLQEVVEPHAPPVRLDSPVPAPGKVIPVVVLVVSVLEVIPVVVLGVVILVVLVPAVVLVVPVVVVVVGAKADLAHQSAAGPIRC